MSGLSQLGSPLKAIARLAPYLVFTLVSMPIQWIALPFGGPFRTRFPLWYHRRCCRLLGIRVERRGRQSRVNPTLYVVNHTSYLDIPVLASLIAGSFVAKAEVARWPLFGWLAKLQRTVFVARRPSQTAEHRDSMLQRLEAGDSLILFPEGTSDDGNRVLPFKSGLLSVAGYRPHGQPMTIQPVSVAYTRLDGLPMGRYLRPCFAWYGDMDMASHLWQAMGLGKLTVVVHFHPPVEWDQFGSRKALTDHCYRAVAQGVAAALSGRRGQGNETATAA